MEDVMGNLILYSAYADKFRKLTDEQFGQLIRCMLSYHETGIVPEIDDFVVALSFDIVKVEIDLNNEKYEKICERNRENGKLGGRPKNPSGFQETQKTQAVSKKPNKTLKNNNKEKEIEIEIEKEIEEESTDTLSPSPRDEDETGEVVYFKKSRKKFVPPTVEEVAEYCRERNNNVDAETFVAFYSSKGWKVGKESMKDWKMAIITWEKRDKKETKASNNYEDAINKASLDKLQALENYYLNGGNS